MVVVAQTKVSNPQHLHRNVFSLAWPAIIEMMLHMTVGIVDTAMVGRLGAVSLAGVGLANQIFFLGTTVFGAIGTGNTALVARHIGAKEPNRAGEVARQSLFLGLVVAVFVMIPLLFFTHQIFGSLFRSTDPEVLAISVGYTRIVALALIFNYCLMLINGTLRGAGDTKAPMRITAVVNVCNIIGNYVLIFGVGPFPQLGIKGAAIATACAHVLGGLLALATLLKTQSIEIQLGGPYRFDITVIRRILKVGIPAALEQGSMRVGQLFYTMLIASLGTASYAAHQVALNAESLSFMPGFGFSLAATTLVGQGLGAEDPDLAERSGYAAHRMGLFIMSVMGVLFFVFPTQLISVFTTDQEVISLASYCLRLIALSQPALAAIMIFAGGLRGAGDTKGILWITTTGFFGIRLFLSYILAIRLGYGLSGAWVAMAIDLNIRGLWIWLRFRSGYWKGLKI